MFNVGVNSINNDGSRSARRPARVSLDAREFALPQVIEMSSCCEHCTLSFLQISKGVEGQRVPNLKRRANG
jgi:hypothetical protein